jgi:WD40 repeat protein
MSKQTIFLLSRLLALAFSIGTMPVNAQTPELVVQSGHASSITAIAFNTDGKVLASASQDGNVKLWDIRTGKQIRTLNGHSTGVYALAFSPDGQTLATADTEIKLWNFATGQLLDTLEGHWLNVNSLAFSPDGQLLASAGSDSLIIIWWNLLAEAKIHATIENTGAVNAIAFSPDGSVLVSGNENGAINWWDVETGELHDSFWYLFEESDVRGLTLAQMASFWQVLGTPARKPIIPCSIRLSFGILKQENNITFCLAIPSMFGQSLSIQAAKFWRVPTRMAKSSFGKFIPAKKFAPWSDIQNW